MSSANQSKYTKFRFKNIGPIKEAELELGDLTVIAGHNNTGKTYLAYTLYGFLKQWAARAWVWETASGEMANAFARSFDTRKIAQRILQEGRVVVPVDREALKQERRAIMQMLARDFSKHGVANAFSSQPTAFKEAAFEVELSDDFPQTVGPFEQAVSPTTSFLFQYDGNDIVIEVKSAGGKGHLDRWKTEFHLTYLYLLFLFLEFSLEPFVLSAERFGIALFYKELDFTKNQLVDMLQKLGDQKSSEHVSPYLLIDRTTSRYALPIKDNIDYTRNIGDFRRAKSEIYDEKLFNDVKRMMGGYFKSTDDEVLFQSSARREGKFEIPLHLASSSARGLSDLYFFLRHVAQKNHLLIIDEPESHLDTANQRLLARLLAKLVQAKVKVLITTHSDYLLKELNILVMLNQVQDSQNIAGKYKYTCEDSIAPDAVRAYVAENNTLIPCKVDRYGIEMPVFDETIDDINRAANDLISRLATEEEM